MVLIRTISFEPTATPSGLAARLTDVFENVAEVRSMMSSVEAS